MNELEIRREKLGTLREKGQNPFANGFEVTHTTQDVREAHDGQSHEELEGCTTRYTVAGRIMALRLFGKAAFVTIADRKGRIQLFVQKNALGEEVFTLFKTFDVGDIVGAAGTPFKTKTGELTLNLDTLRLLTKSLRPLPEKFHGLTDVETRYRQRYVDLTINPEVVEIFKKRSQIIRYIRDFLSGRDFMEVETPMLHPLAGGATAKPFITHHNALDMDLYLRIAPELYLKRLLVGGLERVFEINRSFRNEGLSTRHNPEFTMLEFYWAYATYKDLMTLTEELLSGLAKSLFGEPKCVYTVNGKEELIDFSAPWPKLTPAQAILAYVAAEPRIGALSAEEEAKVLAWDRDFLLTLSHKLRIPDAPKMPTGKLLMEIYEEVAECRIIQPTFIVDFPLEVSPLARKKESDPTLVDRFELLIAGREISNAFSELNDPIDQAERFAGQMRAKAAGDEEAQDFDQDYIRALEFGMPPAAGQGIGIDRLVMLLTNSESIRDVLLFPQLRKEQVGE